MKSLIGKKYVPSDNSYCLILSRDVYSQNVSKTRLAGTSDSNPVECIIVSEPYEMQINTTETDKENYLFINVSYNGDVYRTLFYRENVDADIRERIIYKQELDIRFK